MTVCSQDHYTPYRRFGWKTMEFAVYRFGWFHFFISLARKNLTGRLSIGSTRDLVLVANLDGVCWGVGELSTKKDFVDGGRLWKKSLWRIETHEKVSAIFLDRRLWREWGRTMSGRNVWMQLNCLLVVQGKQDELRFGRYSSSDF